MNKLLPLVIIILFQLNGNAQTLTDTTIRHSPLKTLTDQQYSALLSGDDLYGMALVAELNHYPLPDKVIKLKAELRLTQQQVDKFKAIDKELQRKKLEMGVIIIRNEKMLDSLFRTNRLNNGSLIFYANRYGLYQGELRNAILQACLTIRSLLSQQQLDKFESLQKAN